jgi:ATP-dependent Lon protease
MGKKFTRVSLGGIRDEADIRGHRKTYIGSMPGRIISAIIEAGVNNPLILLDEIDKMASDFKGDPASALLEVLDSEQNKCFRDHYVELPFDLSNCFFVATANTLSTVPRPLLDRMEVIELETYTDAEKLEIAKRHLVPKQLKKHGLNKNQVSFTSSAINKLIDSYTREAGVRNLEREIASACRKCAKLIVDGETKKITVTAKTVVELLDSQQITSEKISGEDLVGCVNGLAWTSVGGEIMKIEVVSMKGNGKIELTGSLGAVMKESAVAALSYIRKNADVYGIDPTFHEKNDIHIHVPEGAVPKDGPSAGIALTTAIISELTGRKIKRNVAMTGEITLTGRVLPIGGLKEKTAAAYKAGVKTVILPMDNKKDILKLDNFIKDKLEFRYVSNYKEIVPLAFAD